MLLVMFRSRDLGSVGCFPHGFMGIREFACRNQRHPKHWKKLVANFKPCTKRKKMKKMGKNGWHGNFPSHLVSICVCLFLAVSLTPSTITEFHIEGIGHESFDAGSKIFIWFSSRHLSRHGSFPKSCWHILLPKISGVEPPSFNFKGLCIWGSLTMATNAAFFSRGKLP